MRTSILIIMTLLMPMVSNAYDVEVDGIYYNLEKDTHEATVTCWSIDKSTSTTEYRSYYKGNIVIPEKIVVEEVEYTVIGIGEGAFYQCTNSIKSISFPNTIKFVGDYAFRDCYFNFSLPPYLETIGKGSFLWCTALTDVVVPESVTSIGEWAFGSCTKMTSVTLPSSLKSIESNTFSGCKSLTSIIIPDAVETIGLKAFADCKNMTSVTIGRGLKKMDNSFYECTNISSVTVNNSSSSFVYNISPWVKDVILGKEVTILAATLTQLNYRESIKVSPEHPFYDSRDDCNAVIATATNELVLGTGKTIVPTGVTSIGSDAFQHCYSLTSITIPKDITKIGNFSFNDCTGLVEVVVESATPLSISSSAFSNCANATLYVPAGSKAAYAAANYWKNFKEIVEVAAPSPVIVFADVEVKALCVANWDTDGDGELSEAEAAAVTKLGTVFKDNEKIKSFDELKYFTGLNKIDSEAFQGCTNLKSIELPAMVTGIGSGAFLNCKSLLSIEIPASVKTLGYQAFCNCTSLTSFTVPASVTYIGERIFVGCSSLASLKVEEGNAVYDSRNDCNAIIKTESDELLAASLNTVIPEGIKKIYDSVFSGRKDLIHVVLPEGLETLGNWVFSGCTNLQSLSFPSTMKDYGEYTISGVTTLRQLIINAREAPANRFRNFFWGVPDEFDIYQFTWYVPKGTRETYVKSIPWWSGKARGIIELGEDTEVITFADEEVQRLCIEKYDANYSGTVDMEEAAGVLEVTNTYFSNKVFNGNTQIKSFDEFQYFIGIEKLDASAFSGCSSLASITLPENLTSIGTSAFGSCSSLTTICIPQNVTTIGSSAFIGCDNMKSVTMMNSTPVTIGQYADPFPLRKMITLRVPKGSKAAYASADYWREFKDIVEIGDAVLAGDANGDGVVDVADVVAIVNYILEKPAANFNIKAADVNGDGNIDVGDVVAVVNIILKGGN